MNSPKEGNVDKESKTRNDDGKGLPDITTAKFKVSQGKTALVIYYFDVV